MKKCIVFYDRKKVFSLVKLTSVYIYYLNIISREFQRGY